MIVNKQIKGLDFEFKEIEKARKNNELLSFDLELSKACNLKCIYCYAESGKKSPNEMTLKEIFSVIKQAKEMGAKKVVIIGGGEPLLYPHYWKVLNKIRKEGLSSITFTNGTMITKELAKKLFEKKEDIAMKFNSFDEKKQDYLAGNVQNTGKKIKEALTNLLEAGYSMDEKSPKLALETIVCKDNYNEIEKIYKYCREKNILPYIEILTIQGYAVDNKKNLSITPQQGLKLFKKLQEYDQKNWKINWPLTPPIVGQTCKRMHYSAYITATGEVQPCPGVNISGGNIKEKKLLEIISNSEIFNKVRHINQNIKNPCKSCKYHKDNNCYGCRGPAYQETGDLFGCDPTCWWISKNKKGLNGNKT